LFIEFIIIVGTPILIQRVNSSFDWIYFFDL
jgi:hypothetical protein